MGSDFVQRQSVIDNVRKLHFLKKAVEKPFILHKLLGFTSIFSSPINWKTQAAHHLLSLSGLVLA